MRVPWEQVGDGRLAVRMPNWLGDALLALPALRVLRRLAPEATLEIRARGGVAEVLAAVLGLASRVTRAGGSGPRGIAADLRELRGASACLLLPNSIGSAIGPRLAGVPLRVGFARELRGLLLTHALPAPRDLHQASYYLALLGDGAPPPREGDAALSLAPVALERARSLAGSGPYAVLVPGAAFGSAKRWGASRFGELGRRFRDRGLDVLVLGTGSERALAQEVAEAAGGRSLAGATDGAAFAGLVAGARLAAVNDSGALHLAAALGTPLVALFGATDPAATGPIAGRARVLYHRVPCSPCGLRDCRMPTHACMEAVEPDEADRAAASLLAEAAASGSGRREATR